MARTIANQNLLPANFNLACRELALLMEHNRPKVLIYSASVAPLVVQAAGLSSWKPVSESRFCISENTVSIRFCGVSSDVYSARIWLIMLELRLTSPRTVFRNSGPCLRGGTRRRS